MINTDKLIRYLGLGLLLYLVSIQFAPTTANEKTLGQCAQKTALPAQNPFEIQNEFIEKEFA
jgi:hypothetical protein